MQTYCYYFILFMIYSFIGWSIEVIGKLIEKHRFINRGFYIGPYCPIYGVGSLLIILLLDKYKSNPVELFIMAILICSILEYYTSYFMEKWFNTRWWDYSQRKFNINGRICLNTMIPFGLLGVALCYFVNPFITSLVDKLSQNAILIIGITLTIIFIIDAILSLKVIINYKDALTKIEKDSTEEISTRIRKLFLSKSYLYKRFIKAFPTFENTKEHLLKLEKNIQTKINNIKNKESK